MSIRPGQAKGPWVGSNGTSGPATDELVKATAADTTAGYLNSKVVVAGGLAKTTLNPGGNEQVQLDGSSVVGTTTGQNIGLGTGVFKQKVAADLQFKTLIPGSGISFGVSADDITVLGDHLSIVSGADAVPDDLESKIVAGAGVTITKLNAGGNEQLQLSSAAGGAVPQSIYAEVVGTGISHGPTANNNFAALAGTYVVGSTRIDTASTTNGVITMQADGPRFIVAAVSFSGSGNTTWEFGLALNGTVIADTVQTRKLGAGGDVGALALTAIHTFLATQTLQLFVRQVGATGGSITISFVNLNEHYDLGDGQIRVSSNDTTPGYLEEKITYEGMHAEPDYEGGNENLNLRALPAFFDVFLTSKPFWVGTQAMTSGDFSVDVPNARINGIAANNVADWIRYGVDGDFDYIMAFNTNGATQGGWRLEGNGNTVDYKLVPGSNRIERIATGQSQVNIAYAGTTCELRVVRTYGYLYFYHRDPAGTAPGWILDNFLNNEEMGYDVKVSIFSMNGGRITQVTLWDNKISQLVRSDAGKAIPLTDGATITPDLRMGNIYTVTLAGNRTLANPTENAVSYGFMWIVRVRQDATGSRTLAWGAKYRFPGGVTPVLTTAANKSDYFGFMYNTTDDKWDCIAQTYNL